MSHTDLEEMTIGMVFDYIDTLIEFRTQEKEPAVREASQADFNAF